MRGVATVLSPAVNTTIFPLEDGTCVVPRGGEILRIPKDDIWDAVKDNSAIRIYGYKHALPALCQLYDRMQELNGDHPALLVGSPQPVLHLIAKQSWAEAVSVGLRLELLRSNMGGWRHMSLSDRLVFKLSHECPTQLSSWCLHPAAKIIHFVSECNEGSALSGFQLAAEMIDPRWFVNPSRPNRTNRLHSFAGAVPSNAKLILEDDFCVRARRARLLTSWCMGDRRASTRWSFFANMVSMRNDPARGWLSACKFALDMLRSAWVDAVTPDRDLFIPRYAFQVFSNGDALTRRYERFRVR